MTLAYLMASEARNRLIASGEYDDLTAPQASALEFFLEDIEIVLDEWLGYRAAPTDYVDNVPVNGKGSLVLPNFPVLSVTSGSLLSAQSPGFQSQQQLPSAVPIQWTSGRVIVVGTPKLAGTATGRMMFQVAYRAGLDPLPGSFKLVTFQLLKFLMSNGGDITAFDAPSRDVTSISVPGMSKAFRVNGGSPSEGSSGSQLDRLLTPIGQYRRLHVT